MQSTRVLDIKKLEDVFNLAVTEKLVITEINPEPITDSVVDDDDSALSVTLDALAIREILFEFNNSTGR